MRLKLSAKKISLLSGMLSMSFLLLYFLKLQIGINFFDSVSIGAYFPFKYLRTDIIKSSQPGVLIMENFNKRHIFRTFAGLSRSQKDTVHTRLSPNGFNGTACVLVSNSLGRNWVYHHRKKVKVYKGDRFQMESLVYLDGEAVSAGLSVSVYDKDQRIIKWNMFKCRTRRSGEWIHVAKQFEIPDDAIKYIQLRLLGSGKGVCRFDDVVFRRLPPEAESAN